MSVVRESAYQYGDFQTPKALVKKSVDWVRRKFPEFHPKTIVEPTCGIGNYLCGVGVAYPDATRLVGIEVNEGYFETLNDHLLAENLLDKSKLMNQNFFEVDPAEALEECESPILIIGNPPWVTNSSIGKLDGANLPVKRNEGKVSGIEALTGASNFDISEPILMECFKWLASGCGILSVLCKTTVARKILKKLWGKGYSLGSYIVRISAKEYFDVSVDACLFTVSTLPGRSSKQCYVFNHFDDTEHAEELACREGILISDLAKFERAKDLCGKDKNYQWRTGVKHDCRKVMELRTVGNKLVNGLSEVVDIEEKYLFPLLKSSDIKNGLTDTARYKVLITQRKIGESTSSIQYESPKTWDYLTKNGDLLDGRRSSVYQSNPRFSIFGVGDYSFSEWKVAISGFYKNLTFVKVGQIEGKPVMLDDTVNFLHVKSESEADFLRDILNSGIAREFLESLIFWENKRPITVDVLSKLNIGLLARTLNRNSDYSRYLSGIERELV